MIASEIKVSSMKLEKSGLSQSDVISQLSEWIRNKAGLATKSRLRVILLCPFLYRTARCFTNENAE
nr:MAG TPA: hypothetical protein [Caudoviricetes sp.]